MRPLPFVVNVDLFLHFLAAFEDPLSFAGRRKLYDLIVQNQGIPATELKRRSEMGWGSFEYHMKVLYESGLIKMVKVGRIKLVYTNDAPEDPALALLVMKNVRDVAHAILMFPGRDVPAYAVALDVEERRVRYQVRQLVDAGLVMSDHVYFYRNLRPSLKLIEAFEKHVWDAQGKL